MSFPVDLAATLSGASLPQLRNWRRTGLLVPEYGSSYRALYSFRDVVALRTVVSLRREIPLQRIRRAFSGLTSLKLTDHPSNYRLTTDGDSVFLVEETSTTDLVRRPGQQVLADLVDVFAPFRNMQGRQVVDFLHPRANLDVREGRMGGWPTISGTRVAYNTIAELMGDGSVPPESVPYYFPTVSAEAVADAVDFDAEVRSMRAS